MDQRERVFILTAETLSMSKTAETLFVSHQCISGHIKSLEAEYGIELFIRKPKLKLTDKGRLLLSKLYEIRRIENETASILKSDSNTVVGKVSLGVPSSRYNPLALDIVASVYQQYPGLRLEITSDFSTALEQTVEKGLVDMAITFFQPDNPNMEVEFLCAEKLYFVVSKKLIKNVFGEQANRLVKLFEKGISIEDISAFPVVQYPFQSRLRRAFDNYSALNNLSMNTVFETNRCDILADIARTGIAGCMIPHVSMRDFQEKNTAPESDNYLHAFPIDMAEMKFSNLSTMLIYHKTSSLTNNKLIVINTIKKVFAQYEELDPNRISE